MKVISFQDMEIDMHYIDYTMDFLKNKLKENCVLCVGFGDNPYFKYDADIKHEHDEIFILESGKKNNDKTIIVTDKDIEKIEIDKNIPIFMSRVFEHLWSYGDNISKLSKITNKLYLVVPDMKRVYKEHILPNLEKVNEIGCPFERFNRDIIEIFSASEEEGSLSDLHAIWTDENSMRVLLPKPWFTINEMSRIENINGYPHLFLEVSVNEELPWEKANLLFKYNYSKPLTHLETIIDIKKLTDYPGLIHRDNVDYWDIEVTSRVSPNESVMVLENNFADVNTSDSGYCVYSLSGCIPKGGLVCVAEMDCNKLIQKLINKKYNGAVDFFKLNNELFTPNHFHTPTKRLGWTSPEYIKVVCEWEGLFKEIKVSDINSEIQKNYILCLHASLEENQFVKIFEKI